HRRQLQQLPRLRISNGRQNQRLQALNIQAPLIRNYLTIFQISPQDPQIQSPTVARDSIMLVWAGPAGVVKPNPGCALSILQPKAHTGVDPVGIGADHPQLEFGTWHATSHLGAPIVLRAEPELVFGAHGWSSCRLLRPPAVQSLWRSYHLKHTIPRRFDRQVVKYIRHGYLPWFPRLMRLSE